MSFERVLGGILRSLTVVCMVLVGCHYGPAWPSRVMVVDLSRSNASPVEVALVAEAALLANGFQDMGKGGRDEIKGQRTSFLYQGPSKIIVSVDVDRAAAVLIRVSQEGKSFSGDAQRVYDEVTKAIESRWSGSVSEDAIQSR